MRRVTIRVGFTITVISLGHRGENRATEICFDVSAFVSLYGEGTGTLLVKRPGDSEAYPVVLTREGSVLSWIVSNTDTAREGPGEAELFWYVGDDTLAKSITFDTDVAPDIGNAADTPPEPYETWLETLTELGAEAQAAAETAAESAAAITGMTAQAETLEAGSAATASYEDGVLTLGIPAGPTGATGPQGPKGDTGEQGPAGVGVPSGGSSGQVLAKASGANYDTHWVDQSGGGGTSDYADLSNKPQIEGVTLSGNKSASDLGLVAAESGKGLSSNDFTTTEKNKLSGIAAGAEVNVQSDWNQSDSSADDFIKNKPSIPAAVTVDSALSDSSENPVQNKVIKSALDGKGTYSKPSGGIPATDLTPAVQTSLGKADTALQSAPVTSVNGQTGAVVLSIPSTAADVGAAPAVTEVTNTSAGDVSLALDAGKIYHFTGAVSSLTLTLTAAASGVIPQYHFDFDSGSTAATVSISGVTWPGGSFSPEASKHYEVDILNGYAVVMAW